MTTKSWDDLERECLRAFPFRQIDVTREHVIRSDAEKHAIIYAFAFLRERLPPAEVCLAAEVMSEAVVKSLPIMDHLSKAKCECDYDVGFICEACGMEIATRGLKAALKAAGGLDK